MSGQPPYIDFRSPILAYYCEEPFSKLNQKEKLYAYYLTRASWEGSKITFFQRSYESPALFYMINKIFFTQTVKEVKEMCLQNGFTEEEWVSLTAYLASFLANKSNYFGFGDKKFIPKIPKEKFWSFIKGSEAYKLQPQKFDEIWEGIEKEIYAYEAPYGLIGGIREEGCLSTFYTPNMTMDDCQFVEGFCKSINLSPLNTRYVKRDENSYEVLVCSSDFRSKSYDYQGKKVSVIYGDYSLIVDKVIYYIQEAQKYAESDQQKQMLQEYIEHFKTGDIEMHKKSQETWLKDRNVTVEVNMGFIETATDPLETKAEFQSFVGIVDKDQSRQISTLITNAMKYLGCLPWPKEFEQEAFGGSQFSCINYLCYAGSWISDGINLPNYDDITQVTGSKNITAVNTSMKPKREKMFFLKPEVADLLLKYTSESYFLTTCLHEVLGHGSGKIFKRDKNGNFNFDKDNLINPLTGSKITTWYEEDETWGMKFGESSNAYEECRAETVAVYLSCFPEILEVFFPGRENEWDDIVYAVWLQATYIGLKGVTNYSLDSQSFSQPHTEARFAILNVLLEAGNNLVQFEETEVDGAPYFYYMLDRNQIMTTGKKAVGEFLKNLQINRAIGDKETGLAYYKRYLNVDDRFLRFRKIVQTKKGPLRIELTDDLVLEGNQEPEFVKFEKSFEGIITSYLEHYKASFEDMYPLWKAYKDCFRCPDPAE